MNPDKLFDYLDGKLPPNERAELEERFMSDPQARQELAVARQIHASMGSSREIVGVADAPISERGAVLARRIMSIFIVLVGLNVAFGIYAIFFMKNRERARAQTEKNRTELAQTLSNAAISALPAPTLAVDEITFNAPAIERDAIANKVVAAANRSGGSAAKGLTNESGILIFAEIPTSRVNEFRDSLKKLGATVPTPTSDANAAEKTILQIRISGQR
jgi:anti-sigma factor RsiW